MASGEFKHIAVTPPEEEDEVIFVGTSAQVAEGPKADEAEVLAAERQDAPSDAEPVEQAGVAEDDEDLTLPNEQPDTKSAAPHRDADRSSRGASSGRKADEYHQTTLEDLNSQKMPLVQKVVIIAAVLCIIGAIGYYLAFMR